MNDPKAFLGNSYSVHRPGPTPAQEPVVGMERPLVAPPATLTIRPDTREGFYLVTLAKALLLAIPHLKAGAAVDLVPAARRGGIWHLDTRPTATRRLPATPGAVARFRIPPISREHLLRPGIDPGRGAVGTVGTVELLSFQLGSEVAGHPGYFELVPLR